MNILIFKFPYNSALGGGELHTLQLFSELRKQGHKFYLASSCRVLLQEFSKKSWAAQKVVVGREPVSLASIFSFTFLAPYIFWRLFFLLLKYRSIKKTNKLYCLTLTEKLLATLPARLFGYRVFWIEHLRIERWLTKNPYRLLYVWLSNLVTTIAVSQAVKKQLVNLGLKDKHVVVIYNGIDINKFQPQKNLKPITHHLPPIIIATVCRLAQEKGIDDLIRAFAEVAQRKPNVELQIAGQGPEKNNLEKLAAKLNIQKKVKFLGFIESVPDFLNKIDVFSLTSTRRESFGIAAAEAAACGKPVVATNISGLAEVVKHNETGLVVKSGDTKAITSALLKLINDQKLRNQMGQQGQKRVKKYFTVGKMVDNFIKVFSTNR